MNKEIKFIYRDKLFNGEVCIDCAENPYFVLVLLKDKELVTEYGNEITILTDFISLIDRKNDAEELVELRQSIFHALKFHPLFTQAAANRWKMVNEMI